MNKDVEEKINRLSLLEQNSQQLGAQRNSFQKQLLEVDSALSELGSSTNSYKIIGSIMVKVSSEKLKEDLDSRKGLLSARVKSLEKQEKNIKDKIKSLQEEVLKALESQGEGEK